MFQSTGHQQSWTLPWIVMRVGLSCGLGPLGFQSHSQLSIISERRASPFNFLKWLFEAFVDLKGRRIHSALLDLNLDAPNNPRHASLFRTILCLGRRHRSHHSLSNRGLPSLHQSYPYRWIFRNWHRRLAHPPGNSNSCQDTQLAYSR